MTRPFLFLVLSCVLFSCNQDPDMTAGFNTKTGKVFYDQLNEYESFSLSAQAGDRHYDTLLPLRGSQRSIALKAIRVNDSATFFDLYAKQDEVAMELTEASAHCLIRAWFRPDTLTSETVDFRFLGG